LCEKAAAWILRFRTIRRQTSWLSPVFSSNTASRAIWAGKWLGTEPILYEELDVLHCCVGWIAAGFAATQRTTYSQGGVGGDPALENWQDAVKEDPGFADSETPFYIGEPWWRWQPIQT
jgi:hypothetical protein